MKVSILNIIVVSTQTVLFAVYFNSIFKPRVSYKVTTIALISSNLFLYIITFKIRSFILLKTPLWLIVLFIIICLLYNDSLKTKVTRFLISFAIIMICEIISFFLFLQIDRFGDVNELSIQRLIAVMIFNITFVSLSMITSIYLNKFSAKEKMFLIGFLIGLPVCQIILLLAIFFNNIKLLNEYILIFAVIGMCFSVFADLAVYYFFKLLSEKSEEEKSKVLIGTYKDLDMSYYELALEESEKILKLKHDILNQLQTINTLVIDEKPRNRDAGLEMLEQLKNSIYDINQIKYCENNIINIILSLKCNEAKKSGIATDVSVIVPNEINIDKIDLCSAFSNLFDNAIEACLKKHTNRFIEIKAGIKLNYLIIKFTNTTKETINISTGELLTTKKDKTYHGLGIKIINDIAKKYDGDFQIDSQNCYFSSILSLKI